MPAGSSSNENEAAHVRTEDRKRVQKPPTKEASLVRILVQCYQGCNCSKEYGNLCSNIILILKHQHLTKTKTKAMCKSNKTHLQPVMTQWSCVSNFWITCPLRSHPRNSDLFMNPFSLNNMYLSLK